MKLEALESIKDISQEKWNGLVGMAYPFLRWEFLYALEESGATNAETGWQVTHLCIFDNDDLVALMPLYIKSHSRGEYIFDYVWANAYERHGLPYYPKWLSAIPFTPCQGPRLVTASKEFEEEAFKIVLSFIEESSQKFNISSWHCLFPEERSAREMEKQCEIVREGVQFQWFNKNYSCFEDFVGTFTSKRRKNLKRERRRVNEQGIQIKRLRGDQVSDDEWQIFFEYYCATYYKRGMPPYLSQRFFTLLAELMPESLLMVIAEAKTGEHNENRPVAMALSLIGDDTLYGRYWGCFEEYDSLHFEVCYYQGIEFCIDNNLNCFNSGAQGEHKISRGFEPVKTYSAHWIRHPQFREAIKDFVKEESRGIDNYKEDTALSLPFANREGGV